jgi:hypothetical protein
VGAGKCAGAGIAEREYNGCIAGSDMPWPGLPPDGTERGRLLRAAPLDALARRQTSENGPGRTHALRISTGYDSRSSPSTEGADALATMPKMRAFVPQPC